MAPVTDDCNILSQSVCKQSLEFPCGKTKWNLQAAAMTGEWERVKQLANEASALVDGLLQDTSEGDDTSEQALFFSIMVLLLRSSWMLGHQVLQPL